MIIRGKLKLTDQKKLFTGLLGGSLGAENVIFLSKLNHVPMDWSIFMGLVLENQFLWDQSEKRSFLWGLVPEKVIFMGTGS